MKTTHQQSSKNKPPLNYALCSEIKNIVFFTTWSHESLFKVCGFDKYNASNHSLLIPGFSSVQVFMNPLFLASLSALSNEDYSPAHHPSPSQLFRSSSNPSFALELWATSLVPYSSPLVDSSSCSKVTSSRMNFSLFWAFKSFCL